MAFTTAEILRRHINDRPRLSIETYYGDGTASLFQVSGYPIVTGCTSLGSVIPSAFVAVGNSWSGTAATFDNTLGTVKFSGVPSALSAFQLVYTYGNFSDAEIDNVTASYGTITEMQLDLIDTLMADSYRRASWGSQGGASYDDSETMSNLMMMRSALFARQTIEQGPLGSMISWDAKQETNG